MAAREWLIGYRGNRTQQAVADKMGINRSTLAKAELGMAISVDTAKIIAAFYGCDWAIFFDTSRIKAKDAL